MLTRRFVAAVPATSRAASSIALKYAHAAYGAALKQSPAALQQLDKELTAISSAIQSTPSLNSFVNDPTISAKDRSKGLEALYAAAQGPQKTPISATTKNLFAVLSENGRLKETPGVIEGFAALMSEYRGEVNVVVTSAAPLPKDIMTRLENSLKTSQAAQKAKSLKVTNKVYFLLRRCLCVETVLTLIQVNPTVLGGIVVDFGDKTIDLSVSSRVNKLNSLLQGSLAYFMSKTQLLILSAESV
jgi:F-type H+-transporting ATPase subunit O